MDTLIISPMADVTRFHEFNVVHTVANPYVLPYEQYHADMQIVKIGNTLVTAPMFYEYYKKLLPGKNLVKGWTNPDGHYPKCSAYNTAITENFAICNEGITDRVILQSVKEQGLEIINVRQGYAKCSLCVFPGGVITSDEGIYKKIHQKIDTLLIRPGFISLPGCEYGFIGGASGYFGKLYFLGDITLHPDYQEIKHFLQKKKIEFEYGSSPLTDFGTAVFV